MQHTAAFEPFGDPRQKIVRQQDDAACGVVCAPSRWEEALLLRHRHGHCVQDTMQRTSHFHGDSEFLGPSGGVLGDIARADAQQGGGWGPANAGRTRGAHAAGSSTAVSQLSCHQHADITTGMRRPPSVQRRRTVVVRSPAATASGHRRDSRDCARVADEWLPAMRGKPPCRPFTSAPSLALCCSCAVVMS